jgi:hypothetical protein
MWGPPRHTTSTKRLLIPLVLTLIQARPDPEQTRVSLVKWIPPHLRSHVYITVRVTRRVRTLFKETIAY